MTEEPFKCAIGEKFGNRCQEQCKHCETTFGQTVSGQVMPGTPQTMDPPTQEQMTYAAGVLKLVAISGDQTADERQSLEVVAAFAEQLAPLLGVLHSALSSGQMPDLGAILAAL